MAIKFEDKPASTPAPRSASPREPTERKSADEVPASHPKAEPKTKRKAK